MAHHEKHGRLTCKQLGGRQYGSLVFDDMINDQRINKVVVRGPRDVPFQVKLYSSEKAASAEPFEDDDLHLIMPPLKSKGGLVLFFDVTGYAFQDRDTARSEPFGKLRVVVECTAPGGDMTFLVAVGGDVPGGVTHGATVFLS